MTYYEILGVPRTATAGEVRAGWKAAMRQCHPDLGRDPVDVAARLARAKQANAAYAVLSDPDARAGYDLELSQTPPAEPVAVRPYRRTWPQDGAERREKRRAERRARWRREHSWWRRLVGVIAQS